MKRLLLLAGALILAVALTGCGGGTGSSSQPSGVNAGVPSVIQLMPVQQIAQTNSYIPIKARVLDGNGNLLPGVQVTFTNLSLVGNLSATTATTNHQGIATVNLSSTTSGFSTVQAEMNIGSGMVRDKRTVFFSDYSLTLYPPAATLTLDVDGNNNGIYNEPSDFILFETPDDNEVIVRATLTAGGTPISGSLITFGADTPEGSFPLGNTAVTDDNGQASVLVKVDPIVLRNFKTVLNITASAADSSGNIIAENVVSLFLEPVVVNNVTVTANPQTVASGGTSTITATVTTTAGSAAPDGTVVGFTTNKGSVTPFSQTTGGVATATFTADTLTVGSSNQLATITASSGGKTGTVGVTIQPPATALTVVPASISVVGTTGGTAAFKILGGAAPYIVTSADPLRAYNTTAGKGTWNVDYSGQSITVTVPAGAAPGDVTLTVTDSTGATATMTVSIIVPTLTVTPASATISSPVVNDTATFTVSGGTAPYTAVSDKPTTVSVSVSGSTVTATVLTAPAATTNVTITITDSTGATGTATVALVVP